MLDAVDAVLERDDDAATLDERRDLRRAALDVPQLDAEHHDVDRRERRRIVASPSTLRKRHVASRALDAQSVLAHRGEMRAARDERDIVARLREPRAEVAADAAGADHRDAHACPRCDVRTQ